MVTEPETREQRMKAIGHGLDTRRQRRVLHVDMRAFIGAKGNNERAGVQIPSIDRRDLSTIDVSAA
jgi:hypothetical protein